MLNRREFIKAAGSAAVGVAIGGIGALPRRIDAAAPDADVVFDLNALPTEAGIFDGAPTHVWAYRGRVAAGGAAHLAEIPGSYLGPVFRVKTGQRVRINYRNDIPASSIVHWHGLHVPTDMDGHPRLVVPAGGTFTYTFTVTNRAGTYWYHPHPHGSTGYQVYGGMAGLFIVTDDEEAALGLPEGAADIPLVIQDRVFNQKNQLVYMAGGMRDRMNGVMGDTILVNGRPGYRIAAETRAYRLRILNGSNARIYDLTWSDGRPLTVIGTDGGLLETPVRRSHLLIGPGERVDLWADFSDLTVGSAVKLVSAPVYGRGDGFDLLRVDITRKSAVRGALPERLSRHTALSSADAVNADAPKQFAFQMRRMQGLINGRVFRMDDVAPEEMVTMGTSEIWDLANGGGHMGMTVPHPVHLHGMQFKVLKRAGVRHDGYLDAGWKDTVLLMPGEAARIQARFADYPGMFLYHCHNLEHEDGGMMRNYFVSPDTHV